MMNPARTSQKKVLIIDDDLQMRQSIRRMLSLSEQYEIEEAEDGLHAEKKLKTFIPDLVIMDIRMPKQDGYETCMRIRAEPLLAHVKIIGMSGACGGIGAAFMESLGADFYFEKPFDSAKFKSIVEKLLAKKDF